MSALVFALSAALEKTLNSAEHQQKARQLSLEPRVIKGDDYRRIAHRLVENGLAFDSELLATLRHDGSLWREEPVTWVEKKGGKVKPLRDAWGMLRALLRIRGRFA